MSWGRGGGFKKRGVVALNGGVGATQGGTNLARRRVTRGLVVSHPTVAG